MARKPIVSLSLSVLIFLAIPSHADYEDGVNAVFDGDFDTAFREFSVAAKAGLDLAQYNLGILYFTGRGVDQDLELAFKWTEAAALQGHVNAQANLASLYFDGTGVKKDIAKGVEWSGRAGKAGHADAAFGLAKMYLQGDTVEKDLVLAHAWANQALRNQHEQAERFIGELEHRLSPGQLSAARRLFARWQIGH